MKITFLGAADSVTGSPVHGEPAAADALRCRIQDELGLSVRVPQHGETFDC
ncbi:MBL fold metallo-hydrolase RNA specificity domain-containing protein [Roseateles sp.]|uniref:MBL fold metallo-hydrolase RNA specificity domain-containing protein n=1 Tax=Roseateles sp. TaxID=1971397 RepID=UPI0032653DB9